MKYTQQTIDFLNLQFSGHKIAPMSFEFNGARFTAVYHSGKKMADFDTRIFECDSNKFNRYLATFNRG